MQPRVLIVCGIYVLLFGAYLLLAFKAVKKKCWKPMAGSIAINTVLLLLILQLGFLWGKTAIAKQTPKEGEYIVSGTNSNNSKYSGKAVISKDGDLYRLKWTIDASPRTPVQEYASVGFIHDGNLCVHFNGAFNGIAVYRISDEQLIGEWVGDSGLNKDGQQKISRGLEVLKRESGLTEKANAGGAQAKEELIKRKAVDDAQRILQEVESRPRIKTDEDNVEKLPFEYYSNELEANATSGDVMAQMKLGQCYRQGNGVGKDYKQAFTWFRKAAEQGNPQAQYNLARCYSTGAGVAKNEKEAVKWYTKSADRGYMSGQFCLGLCYYKGIGVEKDEKKAVKLFTQSALSGHPTAQFSLGLCYDTGTGVEKDENAAVRWYTRSAEQGGVNGQNAVAWVLATSNDPAIRNGKEAEKWAQKAIATTGSTNANSLDTLAAAYAEQGNFAAAVSTQERAVSMLTKQDASKSKEFDDHLKSYQAKKPWRDNE